MPLHTARLRVSSVCEGLGRVHEPLFLVEVGHCMMGPRQPAVGVNECMWAGGVLCAQPSQVDDAHVQHGRGLARRGRLQPIHIHTIYLNVFTL